MLRAVLCVVEKEFLQLRHDRKMIPVMVMGPIVQLLALGFAANMDVTDIALLLVDRDRTAESRSLVDRFVGSSYFEIAGTVDTVDQAEPWLRTGRAQVALVIESGFGRAVTGGQRPVVQVLADGSDSNSSLLGLSYASRIVAAAGLKTARVRFPQGQDRSGRTELLPRVLYNPDLRSRWFFVPAVLALVLMLVAMMLPSMAIVREREIGTLEQISVTPLHPAQLVVGKLLPFVMIGIFDLWLIAVLAQVVLGVPLRGSLLDLTVLTLPFLLSTLGLGLLVSTLVTTQQQAMMFSAFVVLMPMVFLSGLLFPIENMPRLIQHVTWVIPIRYYAVVIRGVFLKGSGIGVLWPEALAMSLIGGILVVFASLRFKKSLD